MHRRSLAKSQKHIRCSTGSLFCRNGSSSSHSARKAAERRRLYEQTSARDAAGLAMTMVHRIVEEPLGWKHTNRRDERNNLRSNLLANTKARAPSTEKSNFDMPNNEGGPVEMETSASESLPPGTFVETRRNLTTSHGVILGETAFGRKPKYCVLMTNGEVWFPGRQDIQFFIPNAVPADRVQRCGPWEESLVDNRAEIDARIEVLKRIRDIEKHMEPALHGASARSTYLYEEVKAEDPDAWERISVFEAAELTRPEDRGIYHVFATHKHMMNDSIHFVAGPEYASNQTFFVRPKSHVDALIQMRDWLRKRENGPIQSFAKRARDVMKANREMQQKSTSEEPTQSPATHQWTADDLTTLNFLQNSVRRTRSVQSDPYSLGQSAIMKALLPKEPHIDEHVVHQTLVDLGVFAPWQDLTMLFPELGVDIQPEETSPRALRRKELAEIGLQKIQGNDPIGPNDLHRVDPLDAIRHDFGDLPVYVIDEPHAQELDDGLSIERIPTEPDNYWVHIHIADPASLIPPTHYLAVQASQQMETVYLNHRSWSMFPAALMHDPIHGLSLGARKDKPTNVMTFSAKLNPSGDIVDFKVRAGLVRNVQVVSYDEVDAATGTTVNPGSYPFGNPPDPLPLRPLQAKQIEHLKDLTKAASYLVDRRFRDGVYSMAVANIEFHNPSRDAVQSTVPTLEPTEFRGFPKLSYKVWAPVDSDSGARGLVAEMAKIASRVASKFMLDKGLPAIRRYMNPPAQIEDMDALLAARTPNGYVHYTTPQLFQVPSPIAGYSLAPQGHFILGVLEGEGYIRATSPLRRYLDLVHHWQIHHALLGKLSSKAKAPFSEDELKAMIPVVDESSRVKRSVAKFHNKFWQVMLLHRHIEGMKRGIEPQFDPLKNLEAVVMSPPIPNPVTTKYGADVYVEKLGLSGQLSLDFEDLPVGSSIPVKIDNYRLGTRCRVEFSPI